MVQTSWRAFYIAKPGEWGKRTNKKPLHASQTELISVITTEHTYITKREYETKNKQSSFMTESIVKAIWYLHQIQRKPC